MRSQKSKRATAKPADGVSRIQRRLLLAFGGMTAVTAVAAFCPPDYQETWVYPYFTAQQSQLVAQITAMDAALSTQPQYQSERLISAVAILTKQKAVAANQIADGTRNTNQNVAVGLNALATAERIKKARFDYGGDFGQGFSPCYVYQTRLGIARSESDLAGAAAAAVRSDVKAAPGRYASPVNAQKELQTEHAKLFCTQDQVDSGLCSAVGSLPGANLSVGTLFKPTTGEEDLALAKSSFINYAAGLPDGEVPQGAASSQTAAAYQMAKIQKDAVRSSALSSLKQIQLESTSGDHGTHGDGDLPLSQQFDTEVKRYFGNTPEHKRWSNVMAAQNDRGVLVELLKVKALDLTLQERQYRQWERIEAQLASGVAVNLKSQARRAQLTADSAVRQGSASMVKP